MEEEICLIRTRPELCNYCGYLSNFSICYAHYAVPLEEEEVGDAYPGVIPVGRGLSTMTRPTT